MRRPPFVKIPGDGSDRFGAESIEQTQSFDGTSTIVPRRSPILPVQSVIGGPSQVQTGGGGTGEPGEQGIRGVAGATGAPGSQIRTGTGVPSSGLGVDSDFYLDTANGNYYLKASGAWTLQGNLRGPAGSGAVFPLSGYNNLSLTTGSYTCANSNQIYEFSCNQDLIVTLPSMAAGDVVVIGRGSVDGTFRIYGGGSQTFDSADGSGSYVYLDYPGTDVTIACWNTTRLVVIGRTGDKSFYPYRDVVTTNNPGGTPGSLTYSLAIKDKKKLQVYTVAPAVPTIKIPDSGVGDFYTIYLDTAGAGGTSNGTIGLVSSSASLNGTVNGTVTINNKQTVTVACIDGTAGANKFIVVNKS
jgi:hypothetical protein